MSDSEDIPESCGREEFVAKVQDEKIHAVSSSLNAVQKGIEETQVSDSQELARYQTPREKASVAC